MTTNCQTLYNVQIKACDTKYNLINQYHNTQSAEKGMMYYANDTKEIYFGAHDGSLIGPIPSSSNLVKLFDSNTIDFNKIAPGEWTGFVKLDPSGIASLTQDGVFVPENYITDVGDTPSVTLSVQNGVLTAQSNVTGDKNYIHIQSTPSTTWSVTHNLGKKPSIEVVDTAGSIVVGNVDYIDSNSLTITFNAGFSGKAFLN